MPNKSKKIEGMLERLSEGFALPRSIASQSNKCTICGNDAIEFRDDISRKEYQISKMCQPCQDSFFG